MISYKKGYKYQLAKTYEQYIPWKPPVPVTEAYITLSIDGKLKIFSGYAWDGPSGPVIDRPSTMRASLVHDALYQLIRQEKLPPEARKMADKIFRDICVEDGVWRWLAKVYYKGLRKFAETASSPSNKKEIKRAP